MPKARSHRRSPPLEYQILLTVTLCLLAAGAVMVYSASSARDLLGSGGDGTGYLVKYCMYGAIGLGVMHVLSRRGLELARRFTPLLMLIGLGGLLAVLVPHVGVTVNGAKRWLGAGPLQFQPSELVKLALVLHATKLLTERRRPPRTVRALGPLLLPTGVACVLVAAQPDLGTALVIGFTLTCVLLAAGVPGRTLATVGLIVAAVVVLFAVVEPYRRARLTSFINPWAHASSTGFQSVQGQIALGSGGMLGRGLGQSVQKVFYLPEAHTDFILAVIGEELGVAGVSLLLSLYGLLAFAGLRVARAAAGTYAKLLAAGLTSLILCQALLNIFAVLGLAPLTGVPLPFISYGSNNLVVLLAAIGVLLNIAAGGRAQRRSTVPEGDGEIRVTRRRTAGADEGTRIGSVARAAAVAGAHHMGFGELVDAGPDRRRGHGGTRGPRPGRRRRAAD